MNEKILVEGKFSEHKKLAIIDLVVGIACLVSVFFSFGFSGIVCIPAGIGCIIWSCIYFAVPKQKLVVTEEGIQGCTIREDFNIPLSRIMDVTNLKKNKLKIIVENKSTGKKKSVTIFLCDNSKEVFDALSTLINNRDAFDEKAKLPDVGSLKQYKELLDLGAITQEEYDAKKEEILNGWFMMYVMTRLMSGHSYIVSYCFKNLKMIKYPHRYSEKREISEWLQF